MSFSMMRSCFQLWTALAMTLIFARMPHFINSVPAFPDRPDRSQPEQWESVEVRVELRLEACRACKHD